MIFAGKGKELWQKPNNMVFALFIAIVFTLKINGI